LGLDPSPPPLTTRHNTKCADTERERERERDRERERESNHGNTTESQGGAHNTAQHEVCGHTETEREREREREQPWQHDTIARRYTKHGTTQQEKQKQKTKTQNQQICDLTQHNIQSIWGGFG